MKLKPQSIVIECVDGVRLHGHRWTPPDERAHGVVIINPATGVRADYYHRYAQFLSEHGFEVLTYDYRGIGASRPASLRHSSFRWHDWGEKDFEAVLRFTYAHSGLPPQVIGHSIGGFLPGLAPSHILISRMLTVGAQFAWWGDYQKSRRLQLFFKWHVVMPALTALFGYFPGKRLGWLEDLPKGVANEWSGRRSRFERSYPEALRGGVLNSLSAFRAPILAVAVRDDPLATEPAIRRALAYYSAAHAQLIRISPADYHCARIGHFDLFHDRHRMGFWQQSIGWLRDGKNPWREQTFATLPRPIRSQEQGGQVRRER
ncbi:hypothetical protein Brsp05_03917 [Brucella sp. NBRC 12953]|uniref:alpha/beta hydrolase family protein n=1 Tax=Brucella sp. NBRC 12953 TaxID=3075481 RepID=UPI0030B6A0D1